MNESEPTFWFLTAIISSPALVVAAAVVVIRSRPICTASTTPDKFKRWAKLRGIIQPLNFRKSAKAAPVAVDRDRRGDSR